MRDAERRAWAVVKQAYDERSPAPRRTRRPLVTALAVAAVAVVVAAIATPPGRAVFRSVREAVGIQNAQPALFSLPSPGRLLVVSRAGGGVWLIHDNGLKRRIGSFTDAQWSPHGLYVIATTRTQLVALDLDTGIRWALPRRARSPRWEGTRTDTRIAYLTPLGLRVVAGDGTGDHLLGLHAGAAPPAWDPLRLHTVAYYSSGAVELRSADTGRLVWRTRIGVLPTDLHWSLDGRYLAVTSPRKVVVLTQQGRVRRTVTTLEERIVDAAFQPRTHRLLLSIRKPTGSAVELVDVDHPGHARTLFAGPGSFGDVAWSPDGRWLLLAWPTADQWLFLHGSSVRAVGNIREQFPRDDERAPRLQFDQRWCCSG